MKRLFISQPMRGKSDEQIRLERNVAKLEAEALMEEPVEVIDSFFVGNTMTPLECLGESLKLMAKADVCYFAAGWREARGCRIEWQCAKEYGIVRIEK